MARPRRLLRRGDRRRARRPRRNAARRPRAPRRHGERPDTSRASSSSTVSCPAGSTAALRGEHVGHDHPHRRRHELTDRRRYLGSGSAGRRRADQTVRMTAEDTNTFISRPFTFPVPGDTLQSRRRPGAARRRRQPRHAARLEPAPRPAGADDGRPRRDAADRPRLHGAARRDDARPARSSSRRPSDPATTGAPSSSSRCATRTAPARRSASTRRRSPSCSGAASSRRSTTSPAATGPSCRRPHPHHLIPDLEATVLDLIIRNGTIVDGSGLTGYRGDVGIRGDRLVSVGRRLGDVDAARVIDAAGKVVAPGFIDPHTHYDAQLCFDPYAFPAIEHGITSVVTGNCSLSLAPVRPAHRDRFSRMFRLIEEMPDEAFATGVDWRWGESFGGMLDAVAKDIARQRRRPRRALGAAHVRDGRRPAAGGDGRRDRDDVRRPARVPGRRCRRAVDELRRHRGRPAPGAVPLRRARRARGAVRRAGRARPHAAGRPRVLRRRASP